MADNRDAQAEIRRLSKELLSAQVRIMEGKDAHRRDEIDLAATSTREMGTRAELDRALNHIQVLKRRLVTANRPLWRKAFGIK
jgi:hypothetical protein